MQLCTSKQRLFHSKVKNTCSQLQYAVQYFRGAKHRFPHRVGNIGFQLQSTNRDNLLTSDMPLFDDDADEFNKEVFNFFSILLILNCQL